MPSVTTLTAPHKNDAKYSSTKIPYAEVWPKIIDKVKGQCVIEMKEEQILRENPGACICLELGNSEEVLNFISQLYLQFSTIDRALMKRVVEEGMLIIREYVGPFPSFVNEEKENMKRAQEILPIFDARSLLSFGLHMGVKEFYLRLADLLIKGSQQIDLVYKQCFWKDLNFVMDSLSLFEVRTPSDICFNFTNTLSKEVLFLEHKVKVSEDPMFRDTLLPFYEVQSSEKEKQVLVQQDLLPFFQNLQVEVENESLNTSIDNGNSVTIIAPSGVGKTAFVSYCKKIMIFNQIRFPENCPKILAFF